MDFKTLFHSVKEACQNAPVLIILVVLGICVSIFIMIDAHRTRKKRSRNRWK
ncbi:MAG: hypothetical protein JWR26_3915 [Pedosphaera sp.]|nr:hypothetical protein [Pedosphaera sp.]